MPPSRRSRAEPYSYLHRDTLVVGDVSVEGRLRVDGTVRGAVRAGGTVEVAPGGRIEGGPVHASDVRIAGSVLGDVHAQGRAEIWKGGSVEGDVHAASLDVEEGARFRGRSVMHGDDPAAAGISADGSAPVPGGVEGAALEAVPAPAVPARLDPVRSRSDARAHPAGPARPARPPGAGGDGVG